MLRSGVWKQGRALERMVLCVVLAVGPLPPYVHLASTWRHLRDECSQAFPILIFVDRVLWTQTGDQNGGPGTEAVVTGEMVHRCGVRLSVVLVSEDRLYLLMEHTYIQNMKFIYLSFYV